MIQYRLSVGKKDEIVDGPDDASVVVTVPLAAAAAADFDPAVAFMQGVLKASGATGELFAAMRSGQVTDALSSLANR